MNINELLSKQRGGDNDLIEVETGQEEEDFIGEGEILQIVSFLLDDVEYGVDILAVHEILRYPDITRLPNTPDFIRGVINLRGNVIPVVDVRVRFGLQVGEITDLTRIIVIESEDKEVGLLVDNVYQVVRLPESHVDEPSELIEGVSEEFIKGIGRLKDRLIVILNLGNMLFIEKKEDEVK
ncbi:MAG TPA: chemotaxis protein CheW [Spirochaetota bacterium]|nr:chemotaxis protein CheW [Spirochaetota bacterium]HPI89672.1 chemotaxis protein CheW [Spirochaetota bacterium]HPR49502.1 chemotaxis protein CheW [Spirochaetota bacterium]